eukprot:scaffold48_cov311-Pinguiococcus_pyrenoidosus.AAC.190
MPISTITCSVQALAKRYVSMAPPAEASRFDPQWCSRRIKGGAWELRQDVDIILQALKTEPACADVCVGIVSNFDDRLPEILECLGIDKYIDFVVTSRQVRNVPNGFCRLTVPA